MERSTLSPETLAAQGLGDVDPLTGALTPGIDPSTNYEQQADGSYLQGRVYTRADNPTYEHAERLLAALEGAGCACALFASGMAAATAIFQSLLPGDHVLVSRVLYWGVRKWLAEFALAWGLDVEFVDTSDLSAVQAAIRPGHTRLLWLETPANPMWEITDLEAICRMAQSACVRVAVDNTVATPVLTRPLELGADLVVHSATKYLNGHSDVLAGAVLTARRDPFWERIRSWRRNTGAVLGPFEAWLLQRGMRTLFLRVQRASETALRIARQLEGHPALSAVLYPGLESHPGHEIAARQMRGGFGGMMSIRFAGGVEHALAARAAVRVFKRATSLGGTESLIEHRRSMEGPSSPVPDDLLRLSVGLEAPEDLIADLEAALEASNPGTSSAPSARVGGHEVTSVGDLVATVQTALERSVIPAVIARGGGLRVLSVEAGVAVLEFTGSPGAVLPLVARIETHLSAAVPEVSRVRLVAPPGTPAPQQSGNGICERVLQVVDADINPVIAAHRGHVVVEGADQGWVRLRFEGGCQGCSMAEVTLRQGIEPTLRQRLPDVFGVIDVTDHAAGTNPFFSAEKR